MWNAVAVDLGVHCVAPLPGALASLRTVLEMQTPGPAPDLLSQELQEPRVLTGIPGDAEELKLRTAALFLQGGLRPSPSFAGRSWGQALIWLHLNVGT